MWREAPSTPLGEDRLGKTNQLFGISKIVAMLVMRMRMIMVEMTTLMMMMIVMTTAMRVIMVVVVMTGTSKEVNNNLLHQILKL